LPQPVASLSLSHELQQGVICFLWVEEEREMRKKSKDKREREIFFFFVNKERISELLEESFGGFIKIEVKRV
jgi:hypothetical protein